MTGLKDKVQHLKALYRDRNLAADGKVLLTHETVYIARNDLEDSGWLSPEIEINSLDKIPLGEYLQAGISKMKSTDWA